MRRDATRAERRTRSIPRHGRRGRSWPAAAHRGQCRRAFEVRTSDIRARIGRTASRSKIRNRWRVSDTARQIGQINEYPIWASIEFRTRGAIPFARGADGIACDRARPSRLILSIQDSYQTSLFALPWLNDRCLRTPAVPGGGFERPNVLIAGGPDPNALIQVRDRLAAHLERLAYRARWCVCRNLHHWCVWIRASTGCYRGSPSPD